jgi:hypothetical protein
MPRARRELMLVLGWGWNCKGIVRCPTLKLRASVSVEMEAEGGEERTVTKRERKDIRWIIGAFFIVFVVACLGLFGSFGLLAGTH